MFIEKTLVSLVLFIPSRSKLANTLSVLSPNPKCCWQSKKAAFCFFLLRRLLSLCLVLNKSLMIMSVGVREAKMHSLFTSYCRKCSLVVSSFFCWWNMFLLYLFRTAFAASQWVLVLLSVLLLISIKDACSFSKYLIKSGSIRSEVIMCYLGGRCG